MAICSVSLYPTTGSEVAVYMVIAPQPYGELPSLYHGGQ